MAKILFVIVSAMITATVGVKGDQGGCSCGVFPENSRSVPIIVQSLEYKVSCDEEGAEICKNLCIALAQGARDQAPALICENLGKHVENLKVEVYTKTTCGVKNEWNFTGLKSPKPICCDEGKETACNNS